MDEDQFPAFDLSVLVYLQHQLLWPVHRRVRVRVEPRIQARTAEMDKTTMEKT